MASKSFRKALGKRLPVLFANIGWAHYYDGTESIRGNHAYLKRHPESNFEFCAFERDGEDGLFYCGAGRGRPPCEQAHVVFVARDPADGQLRVVGIYAAAEMEKANKWTRAVTRHALLIPSGARPVVKGWPSGQGVRRWAWRGGARGSEHAGLRALFVWLRRAAAKGGFLSRGAIPAATDESLHGIEGARKKRLVAHRQRESRLRQAKIRAAMEANRGRLVCEVPKCGFDFFKRYGDLGFGYAQVHHLRPLGAAGRKGMRTELRDLAIVCANCHAMIHKGGDCRPMKGLIR